VSEFALGASGKIPTLQGGRQNPFLQTRAKIRQVEDLRHPGRAEPINRAISA